MMGSRTSQLPPSLHSERPSQTHAAFDHITLEILPRLALISGLCYVLAVVYARVFLPKSIAPIVITISALSAFLSFIIRGSLRTWPLRPQHASPVLAIIMSLALLNSLYPIYLTGEPQYTMFLMLVVVIGGLVFLAPRWLIALFITAVAAWINAVPAFALSSTWTPYSIGLLLAVATSSTIHIVRRRHCEHIATLTAQNEQQEDRLRRQTAHAETSIAVSYRIGGSDNLETMLNQIVEIVRVRYGYTYAGIFLLDETGTELIARAGTGSAGRAAIKNGSSIKIGRGIIGWVAENRRMIYASDTAQDPRFVVWDLRPDTRSELTLPLRMGEQLLGVLDLQSDQAHAFSKEDIAAMQLLADQITLAIHNALLSKADRERQRFAETLQHIGRALSRTLDKQEVLELILQQLVSIIPHDRGAILLQNDNILELVATRGFPKSRMAMRRYIPVRPGDVFNEIRRTQRLLVLDDALQRADWFHLDDLLPTRSWMGVPLIHEDKVIGMLSLARETHAPYTDDEIIFAAVFAWQATIALENARLYEQLSEQQKAT